MNPARSLGPAVVSGRLEDLWIFWLAPGIGAVIAIAWCRLARGSACCGKPGAYGVSASSGRTR
jgi:hypothetical protein